MNTETIEINADAADLATTEQKIAQRYGFKADDADLWFAKGTTLMDVGHETSRKEAATYAAMPTIDDAAVALSKTIAAEQRRDRDFEPAGWRLNVDGKLAPLAPFETVAGNGTKTLLKPEQAAVGLNGNAFSQLASKQAALVDPLPRPTEPGYEAARAARDKLAVDKPELIRAWQAPRGNLNAWLGHVEGPAKMRVRNAPNGSGREAFAVVSKRYVAYDADAVLKDIAQVMPGCKADVKYDAEHASTRARVLVQAPIDIPSFVGVGRVHQAGIEFRTSDDGSGSLTGSGFLVRIRCKNHTLTRENATTIRRRHTGTLADLQAQIGALLGTIPEMIEEMRSLWARKASEHYLDTDGTQLSVREAITRLVANGHVPTGGEGIDGAIARYMDAWAAEDSPNSAAGILMAIQRAAHESDWRSKYAEDEIETSASKLLYQTVSVRLAAPADLIEMS